jgi:leucyl/phenylalanyl-tRNA---protein transferase
MSAVTPEILLQAYGAGIFPMAEKAEDTALYWVEPDERGIFPLDGLHIAQSLRKIIRKKAFDVRVDTSFSQVMEECARKTASRPSTWINKRILKLYSELHSRGHAHSVECWQEDQLVGGLYGVKIGAAFFGESMFSKVDDASKVALVHLVARLKFGKFKLLDAQFINPHLKTMGAVAVSKAVYKRMLAPAIAAQANFNAFTNDGNREEVLRLAMPP